MSARVFKIAFSDHPLHYSVWSIEYIVDWILFFRTVFFFLVRASGRAFRFYLGLRPRITASIPDARLGVGLQGGRGNPPCNAHPQPFNSLKDPSDEENSAD